MTDTTPFEEDVFDFNVFDTNPSSHPDTPDALIVSPTVYSGIEVS